MKRGKGKPPTAAPLPDVETLRAYLRYDPETGKLFWKKRDHPSHQRFVGREALNSTTAFGYKRSSFLGKNLMAHRVIWKMVFGYEPNEIDHINGDTGDNRICNLRDVSRQDNVRNVRRKKDNKSGCTGVYFRRGYWIANIRTGGKQIDLGYFRDKDLAVSARKAAEREYGYHPNHGRAA